jgi:hypothetical protein
VCSFNLVKATSSEFSKFSITSLFLSEAVRLEALDTFSRYMEPGAVWFHDSVERFNMPASKSIKQTKLTLSQWRPATPIETVVSRELSSTQEKCENTISCTLQD